VNAPLGVPLPRESAPVEPLRPMRGLGRAVMALLWVCAAADVVAVVADVRLYQALRTFPAESVVFVYDWDFADAELLYQRAGWVQLGAMLVTAVVFLVWFHRARTNAQIFAPDGHRKNPGWAIGGWFVPIGNLWLPKQVADDVWRASVPPQRTGERGRDGMGAVHLWWALWVTVWLTAQLSARLYLAAPTAYAAGNAILLRVVADALDLAAAGAAMVVVQRLSAHQDARRAHETTHSPTPPAPVPAGGKPA
jgi:hypothetical protein